MSEFIFNLQRFAYISNDDEDTLLSGTSGNDVIWNDVENVIINAGKGNDSIKNGQSEYVSINGGAGNDTIRNEGYFVTMEGGDGNDYFYNSDGARSLINGGNGDDYIDNSQSEYVTINGGAGNDYILNDFADYVTIAGGKGNDTIYNDGGNNVLIKYNAGDGFDVITSFNSTSTLQIGGGTGTYSSTKSGNNIIVTVGTGKITLLGAANGSIHIEGKKSSVAKNSWTFSGTTAKYGTSSKTLVTVNGVKSLDGLSLSGKVVTVAKFSLSTNKVTISGTGYTLALGKNVTKTSTSKAWSLSGSTATYKQDTKAGYKLASDGKSISYTKKATKTLATINGAKKNSGFTLSGKTIKLAAASLSKKVSVSGSYAFEFAAGYKNALITGSTANDTIKALGSNVTIRGGKGDDSLVGSSGADVFVYASGDGNDVITNYDAADKISITSGAAKVSMSGDNVVFTIGKGKITLQKAKGKTITYFAGGKETVYSNKQSSDVVYSKNGKLATLKDTYDKDSFEPSDYSDYSTTLVTIDASAVEQPLKITGNNKANRITGTEEDDTIKGGLGGDTLLGSAGNDELYGEKGNDLLVGGSGSDTLWGGKGDDTLTGGAGKDIFCYDAGDGNDTITDYSPGVDTVMILSDTVNIGNPTANKSGDVTFTIGSGQITFQNCASKTINLVNKGGNILKTYSGS